MYQEEERILNARKLIFYIMYRWKFIFLLFLLGGLLLGGFKYYRDLNAIKAAENIVDKDSLKAILTDKELQDVNAAVSCYTQLQDTREYMVSAPAMSLNAESVDKTTLQLMIELSPEVQIEQEERIELINNIVSSYAAYVNTGALIQDIYDLISADMPAEYIQDLILADTEEDAYDNTSLSVYLINLEPLQGKENVVADALMEYSKKLNSSVAPHTLKLIDTYSGTTVDMDLYNRQQNMWNAVYNYESKVTSMVSSFSADQLACYNALIGEKTVGVEGGTKQAAKLNVGYILIGAILGALAACFLILLQYMLSGYLVSETDYVTMFGLKYIGMVFEAGKEEEYKPSFVQQMEYGDNLLKDYKDTIGFLALKIKLACKVAETERVALISSNYSNLPEEVCQDLIKRLQKEGIEAVSVDHVLTEGTAMSQLVDIGSGILVESTGKSRIDGIRNVVELCCENEIKTLGVIDVK